MMTIPTMIVSAVMTVATNIRRSTRGSRPGPSALPRRACDRENRDMSDSTTTGQQSETRSSMTEETSTAAHLLVGVDGSGGSQHALTWAAAHTGRFGLIQPLTTWQYPWWAYTGPTPPPADEFKRLAQTDAESVLESIPIDRYLPLIVTQGQAGPTLVNVGATSNLIVVGTRGRSGLKDTLLGSVSSHVVAHATKPVAVVPADAPSEDVHKRVVVGVDGSSNSITALVWALEHTDCDSAIEVVHTWAYPPSALPDVTLNPRADFENSALAILDKTVGAALEAKRSKGGHQPEKRIVKRLEYGDARAVLRELQQDSDLLVVGARGRGPVAHLLLGSVTSALVHQPTTTMVVVPVPGAHRG